MRVAGRGRTNSVLRSRFGPRLEARLSFRAHDTWWARKLDAPRSPEPFATRALVRAPTLQGPPCHAAPGAARGRRLACGRSVVRF